MNSLQETTFRFRWLPMWRLFRAAVLGLLAFISSAQAVDLLDPAESFETDGEGTRYLSNAHSDGGGDHFHRHNYFVQNPHPAHNVAVTGVDGSWAWAGEDVDADSPPSGPFGYVRLNDLDVTGNNNLEVTVSFGKSSISATEYEPSDFIRVQAAFDANSGGTGGGPSSLSSSGAYTTVGQFLGTGITGEGLANDANLNGVIDGAETQRHTSTMTDYTFLISGVGGLPASGTHLSVQIVVGIDGGNEEIVFDNIRITGDSAVTNPPVLAIIEAAPINYTEGDPATQVTNTIAVTDSDSANLESGTVSISGGVPAEDQLNATGVGSVTVAGNGTSTLALSGTGSLAEYQQVLRSVTYTNSNLANPSTATRTVNFQVNDGTNPSNGQSRAINVAATIGGPFALPYCEDLDSDGEGVRYTSNTFNSSNADYFERTDLNPHPGHFSGAYTFAAPQGGGYYASEDVNTEANPLGASQPGIFRLADLDIAGLSNLQVTLHLADQLTSFLEAGDRIEVQVAFDGDGGGVNLLGGSYTTIGRFVGDGSVLRQDTNLDGLSTDPADTGSPTLNRTFTPYTFSVLGTGTTLSVQVLVVNTAGNEEVAFDHIKVDGVVAGAPPVLASVEATPASFTEGGSAVQVSNTVTASDPDSSDLEGATIQITTGYQNGQDILAVNGALPVGITEVAFAPGTGSIGLTGTASVADYQTALRQITYNNTSANPNICDRTINFQVSDNASNSNIVSRMVHVSAIVAPGTIPYLEDFDSDGDGVRYTSNSFTDGAGTPGDYFERTDLNPHPGHQSPLIFSAPQSGGYFAAEDITASGTINKLGNMGIVRLPNLDASSLVDLKVSLYLAQSFGVFEAADKIEIQYAFDGDIGGTDLTAGSYTTIGRFVGAGGSLTADTNLDGSGDGAALSTAMTEFEFDVPSIGTTLSVQIKVSQNSGNEEFAFDHIQVTGTEAILSVAIAAASIGEADGTGATTAIVTRNTDTTNALTVSLMSDDQSEAVVPPNVTIAAGQTSSAPFDLDAVDDAIVDGTKTVTITASATGYTDGTDTVDVTDDDVAALTVSIAAASVGESDGPAATTATVSRNTDTTSALLVMLDSNDTSEVTVPVSVNILAGQASVDFDIDAEGDILVDGTQTVTITASASGHLDGTDTLDVTDDEVATALTDWRDGHFSQGDLADPGREATVWGSGADPDGDCLLNIFEFLYGSDPNVFDLTPPIAQGTSGATFATVSFKKRKDISGTTLDVQVSSNRNGGFASVVNVPNTVEIDADFDTITYTDDVSVVAGTPRFVKLFMSSGGANYESETFGTSCLTVTPHTTTSPGTLTFMGLQFVKSKVANGTATAAAVNTLTDSNAQWPAGGLVGYYVRITSGVDEGVMADITANTGTELTLSDDLSAFAVVGQPYEIRPHTTVECVFGTNNEAGLLSDLNSMDADNVLLVSPGGVEQTIFYSSADNLWRDNNFSDVTQQEIAPEQGFVVRRKDPAALNIYNQGALLIGKKVVPIENGFNLIGTIKSNAALTLDDLGLFTGDDATGVSDGLNPLAADNLLIVNPDGTTSLYFYLIINAISGWHDVSYNAAGTVPVAPGSSFYFRRRPANAPFNWTIPVE